MRAGSRLAMQAVCAPRPLRVMDTPAHQRGRGEPHPPGRGGGGRACRDVGEEERPWPRRRSAMASAAECPGPVPSRGEGVVAARLAVVPRSRRRHGHRAAGKGTVTHAGGRRAWRAKKISPTLSLPSCRSHRPLSPPFPFPCSLSSLGDGGGVRRSAGPCCDVDIPRRRGRGRARAAREDNERAPLRSPVSLLPAAGLRSPSSTPPASGPPPPRRRSPVPLLPAASRPAAHLPDGQLLVCSPPRAGGWAPAPAGGSPVRWAACRLTPAPAGLGSWAAEERRGLQVISEDADLCEEPQRQDDFPRSLP
ncbi:protein enabled homolog [Panicum virgatum]|uniref:protein enabled homolog n=1 Tax=Panicum virgatum TaxID=38727 RepID=UPI0019D60C2C|nr:protein enabled homolog [Panicum virgatum]